MSSIEFLARTVALAAEDKTGDAQQAWNMAVNEGRTRGGPAAVFAAGALQKLGQTPEAEKMLAAVAERANEPEASAHALYAAGLAERFRNHEDAARADFRHALELDPLFWQARFELNRDLAAGSCASRYTSSPAARQNHDFKKSRNTRMALRDPTAILVLLQAQEVSHVSE